jgi:hypothetical protein
VADPEFPLHLVGRFVVGKVFDHFQQSPGLSLDALQVPRLTWIGHVIYLAPSTMLALAFKRGHSNGAEWFSSHGKETIS